MGRLRLKYFIGQTSATIQTIVNEFEYGSTFSLYPTRKETLSGGKGKLKWVQFDYNSSSSVLDVLIDDRFLCMDFFFEKFMTLFLYNLLDFGEIYLSEIDLSESVLGGCISKNKRVLRDFPLIGTIFKPYYHQTADEKILMAKRFIELGCNVFKNDECFFLNKNDLLAETKSIQAAIGSDACFVPNITAYIADFSVINSLIEIGTKVFMVDYLISGFKAVYKLKQSFPDIIIWGHRIGYETIKCNISMDALCVIAQLAGIDWLHVGTPRPDEVLDKKHLVDKQKSINPNFKPIFTITTPEILKYLLPVFGDDAIYLGCGYYRDKDGNIDWDRVKTWCDSFQ